MCSIRHFPRVRFFFDRLYRSDGYTTRYRYVVRPLPSLPLVRHELRSIARMARDRRRALRLLDEADRAETPRRALGSPTWGRRLGDDDSVAMGLLFYPRGGSALVAAYLSRALVAQGWHVDARVRIAGRRKARSATRRRSSPASRRCPPPTTTRSSAGGAGGDPMDAPFPMHPSYEEREGVPDRSFPQRVARAGRAHGRRVVAS